MRNLLRNIQRGKFMLAYLNIMCLIINGGIKTGLAVAVAMKIAKTNVARVGNFHRPRKRLIGTDDAVAVEIGESNVVGRINFNRQRKSAFAPLLFGLQRIKAPMGGIAHLNFVADMMLARNLVGAAFSLGVGDEHTSLSEGRRRPKVEERAASSVGDPCPHRSRLAFPGSKLAARAVS